MEVRLGPLMEPKKTGKPSRYRSLIFLTMENTDEAYESDAFNKVERWKLFVERTTLAFSGACSGVIFYLALFPSFYYLTWIFFGIMLWAIVGAACLLQGIAMKAIARWKRVTLASSPANGFGFIIGMLVVVSLMVAFKLPLHASFLLARPGLEEALEQHSDDLSQVAYSSHNYGIYRFSKADRRCHHKDRVFFQFLHDGEAAIIYSESGIEELC